MWTSIVDLSPGRIFLTQLLGRFWRGAYFSSFAPLQVRNVPRQALPSQSWVRVRNRLAGICGSDLHFIYADGDIRVAPAALPGHGTMYLGHEVVGEVIEKGDDVQLLNVGDRVVLQHGPNCLSANVQPLCRFCASGHYGLCERGKLPGPSPIGGGWSEEMLLHEQQLFRISDDMTDEQAVMLEPSAVAVHAVLRHPPQNADRVLIIGAGTIGLLTLQVVHALAPQAEISVLARYPFQVEKATRMGAAHIIYPQDSYQGVQRATEGKLYQGMFGNTMLLGGYDVIYDTIGSRNTLHNALRWARAKSTIVLVGLSLHMMNIDLTPIWYQEVNLLGTLGQGMEQWPPDAPQPRSTFSVTVEMIERGLLHPEKLVTHHFALDNYQHALMTAADKGQSRATKVVFDYSLLPASVVPNVRASASQRRPATVDVITPQVTARIFDEQTRPVEPHEPQTPQPPVEPQKVADVQEAREARGSQEPQEPYKPQTPPTVVELAHEPQTPQVWQEAQPVSELGYAAQAYDTYEGYEGHQGYEAYEEPDEYDDQVTAHTLPVVPNVAVFDMPTVPVASSGYEEPLKQEIATPSVVAEEEQTVARPLEAQYVASEPGAYEMATRREDEPAQMPFETMTHEEQAMVDAPLPAQEQATAADEAAAELEYEAEPEFLPELEYVAEPEFAYRAESEGEEESQDVTALPTGPLSISPDEEYGQEEGEETKNATDTLLGIRTGKTVISSASGAEQATRRPRTRKKGGNRR